MNNNVFVAITKAYLNNTPEGFKKPESWSPVLITGEPPTKENRDKLIEFINMETDVICDEITSIVIDGEDYWKLNEREEYKDKWEDRKNKLT